jgi:hypothetical protein
MENAVMGESYIGEGSQVCSYEFAPLRHSDILSLVYGEGVINRPSCRDVYIIDPTKSGGFEMFSNGDGVDTGGAVSGDIRDLRGDGRFEFLLSTSVGEIRQRCTARWAVVYAWTGANYTDVSEQFMDFYRHRLEKVNKTISTLERPPSGEFAVTDKECLGAEAAALKRFLGISPDAGVDQAIRLARSDDSAERAFAAQLLYGIGTAAAREYLAKLASDKDKSIAAQAKRMLGSRPRVTYPAFSRYPPIKSFP